MMRVIDELVSEGYPLNESDLGFLSPYGRSIKRFGNFELDMKKPPEPWLKHALFRQAARQARAASDQLTMGSEPPASPKGGPVVGVNYPGRSATTILAGGSGV